MRRDDITLDEWHWLHEVGFLDAEASLNERIRLAAPRLGKSVDALEKYLHRRGIRNPVPPSQIRPPHKPVSCRTCHNRNLQAYLAEDDVTRTVRLLERHPESERYRAQLAKAQAHLERMRAGVIDHQADHAEQVAA